MSKQTAGMLASIILTLALSYKILLPLIGISLILSLRCIDFIIKDNKD